MKSFSICHSLSTPSWTAHAHGTILFFFFTFARIVSVFFVLIKLDLFSIAKLCHPDTSVGPYRPILFDFFLFDSPQLFSIFLSFFPSYLPQLNSGRFQLMMTLLNIQLLNLHGNNLVIDGRQVVSKSVSNNHLLVS
jgi:hypothetical protein